MIDRTDRDTFLAWCRRVDEGPFSTLAVGERITYHNLEMMTSLAAAASVTERVRLMSTVVILPMHPANLIAKQMATIDVISGGRLDVGVGVGGRDADFRAVEGRFDHRHQRMDDQVAQMRRVWAGEPAAPDLGPIGPRPVQAGGPPVYAGVLGPKAIARAAQWAVGVTGFVTDPDQAQAELTFINVRDAWDAAGRSEPPVLTTSFWYGLGADGDERARAYARRYLGIFGDDFAVAMADSMTMTTEAALLAGLGGLADAGCDEIILVPTTDDLDELDRTIEVINRFTT
ncbi:MAG TPA: LLM class flavin-dependent oxidoreductase [Acidimicrobiales bacterium]|nr:LLM class flavin-dependent oxidoreductase [Acidimicrobiales bacterium]